MTIIKIVGIYSITNSKNGKRYIGQSIDIKNRVKGHFVALNGGTHYNDVLQKSFNKHGKESFYAEILCECPKERLDEKETFYINYYNTLSRDYGYNLKEGGSHPNLTEMTRNKISKSKIGIGVGRKHSPETMQKFALRRGKLNGFYGKHHTQSTKEYLSNIRTGQKLPPRTVEHSTNLSKASQGRKSHCTKSSKFLGVSKRPNGKWQSSIVVHGKKTYLGVFVNEIDAACAYNLAALDFYGHGAKINKIDSYYGDKQ